MTPSIPTHLRRSFLATCLLTALTPLSAETVYEPSWKSLQQYKCPEWFRDAKYGIFMHWGVNTVPAYNGHYGRYMYIQNDPTVSEARQRVYKHHVDTYGHPSKFGYKDFIPMWKAENWDPDELVSFYKENGVRYIVPVAVHCDNFDNYDSSHQEWNSVRMGPKRDTIAEWKKAAETHGLRFGVSSHVGDWARRWYDQTADQTGPLAGVPYDVIDPKAAGLYGVRGEDRTVEAKGFPENWFLRTKELVDKYQPDILYFDGRLPYDQLGLQIAAHFYNENTRWHDGSNDAVLNVKHGFQEGAIVHDIEKGQAKKLRELPWQTDTTINTGWFYQEEPDGNGHEMPSGLYLDETVLIDTLVDIVSKNGNLLLNVGLKADGTLPDDQRKVLRHIGDWLKLNGEAIHETRPWVVYGEGPTQIETGFDTQHRKPWKKDDIRFTTKGDTLYAIVMDWPGDGATITIKSIVPERLAGKSIEAITMIGSDEKITWKSEKNGLQVTVPQKRPGEFAHVLKIATRR